MWERGKNNLKQSVIIFCKVSPLFSLFLLFTYSLYSLLVSNGILIEWVHEIQTRMILLILFLLKPKSFSSIYWAACITWIRFFGANTSHRIISLGVKGDKSIGARRRRGKGWKVHRTCRHFGTSHLISYWGICIFSHTSGK